MNHSHDPARQENYIRQSLSQDKKPLGLFLGAGCPLAIRVVVGGQERPIIPDIPGLTEAVSKNMATNPDNKKPYEIVLSHLRDDGLANPNIEEILSHIRALRAVAGRDQARGLTALSLDALDKAMCTIIVDLMDKRLPDRNTPYHRVASWVGTIPRDCAVEIFTINYDLLLEQAMEESRVPYFDGFVGSNRTFFDPHAMEEDKLPSRWARIWKLHGSINWRQDDSGAVSRGEEIRPEDRRVIHPSHLKYDESRRMPYLAMVDRLRDFLKRPSSVLVTCGYSFRDLHLNEVIIQGLQGNSTAHAFGLLFSGLDKYPIALKLAGTRANLSLLAEDQAVVNTRKAGWIKKDDVASAVDSIGCKWVAQGEGNAAGQMSAKFLLGDFSYFGRLLEELVGADRDNGRASDAQ